MCQCEVGYGNVDANDVTTSCMSFICDHQFTAGDNIGKSVAMKSCEWQQWMLALHEFTVLFFLRHRHTIDRRFLCAYVTDEYVRCENEGVCRESFDNETESFCTCPSGFTGPYCDIGE